jgi:hypothetical protein
MIDHMFARTWECQITRLDYQAARYVGQLRSHLDCAGCCYRGEILPGVVVG